MIKRIIAGTVTAGLLGVTPLAVSAPAQAADNWTTTTVATPSTNGVVYGDDLYVSVDISSSDGYSPGGSDGTSTLYAMEAGSTAWVPVATASSTYSSFYDVKPKMNTAYKVVYSGFTDPDQGTYGDNYAPSESAPFTVAVQRNVSIDKAKARMTIKGKVKPTYKRKKVKIRIKKGKRYVKYRTIKTDRRSRFTVRLPAPRRGKKLFFKITVPGNSQYVKYSEVWYTYSYRPAAPRVSAAR